MFLYSKCKVNPEVEGFVEKFKSLHPDFKKELFLEEVTEEQLFTYIVLTFDIESPYVIKYADWVQRRRPTARASKFPRKNNKYIDEVDSIIVGKNKRVNDFILRYMFLQNDIDFIKFASLQFLYAKQVSLSQNADYDNPGHYDKLKHNLDDLARDMKSLRTSIFHGDETKDMLKSFYDFTARITTDIRPEDRADRIEKGEPVVDDSPYGDYKKEPMTFSDDH